MNSKIRRLIRIGLIAFTAVVITECIRETATPRPAPEYLRTQRFVNRYIDTEEYGRRWLRIRNKTNLDAVVVLTLPDEPQKGLIAGYTPAGQISLIRDVRRGMYAVYITLGEDWDKESKKFARNISYFRFKDLFNFLRRRRRRIVWTITLGHGVTGKTEKVRESEFPALTDAIFRPEGEHKHW